MRTTDEIKFQMDSNIIKGNMLITCESEDNRVSGIAEILKKVTHGLAIVYDPLGLIYYEAEEYMQKNNFNTFVFDIQPHENKERVLDLIEKEDNAVFFFVNQKEIDPKPFFKEVFELFLSIDKKDKFAFLDKLFSFRGMETLRNVVNNKDITAVVSAKNLSEAVNSIGEGSLEIIKTYSNWIKLSPEEDL